MIFDITTSNAGLVFLVVSHKIETKFWLNPPLPATGVLIAHLRIYGSTRGITASPIYGSASPLYGSAASAL